MYLILAFIKAESVIFLNLSQHSIQAWPVKSMPKSLFTVMTSDYWTTYRVKTCGEHIN